MTVNTLIMLLYEEQMAVNYKICKIRLTRCCLKNVTTIFWQVFFLLLIIYAFCAHVAAIVRMTAKNACLTILLHLLFVMFCKIFSDFWLLNQRKHDAKAKKFDESECVKTE